MWAPFVFTVHREVAQVFFFSINRFSRKIHQQTWLPQAPPAAMHCCSHLECVRPLSRMSCSVLANSLWGRRCSRLYHMHDGMFGASQCRHNELTAPRIHGPAVLLPCGLFSRRSHSWTRKRGLRDDFQSSFIGSSSLYLIAKALSSTFITK